VTVAGRGSREGERFRRRALRRGYKVDEVDAFLDRVEETIAGESGTPVTAREVRDVIFRVRFGGYDEWQVDKQLDRLERQLEALQPSAVQSIIPPVEPHEASIPDSGRYEPDSGPYQPESGRYEPDAGRYEPSVTPASEPARRSRPAAARGTTYGGGRYGTVPLPGSSLPGATPAPPPGSTPHPGASTVTPGHQDPSVTWPGRHGKRDMTMEMPTYGRGSAFTPADAQRVEELRAGFKTRRFGSGYDSGQVDRLFDGISAVVTGRSGGAVDDSDLDSGRFGLVQGGYFEEEVDRALREVREILSRGRR
jgi:DivIVA domain-containing protein